MEALAEWRWIYMLLRMPAFYGVALSLQFELWELKHLINTFHYIMLFSKIKLCILCNNLDNNNEYELEINGKRIIISTVINL